MALFRNVILAICFLAMNEPCFAMDTGQYQEVQKLMQAPSGILAKKASEILRQKYEIADFALHNGADDGALPFKALPDFVTSNPTSYTAYRIAVLRPELLSRQQCYCDRKDHPTLLQCFLISDKPLIYNDHAATAPVCIRESLLVFLWSESGISPGEITGYLRFLFDPEINQPPQTSLN
ncbi:hypothetical protein [Geotalea sp. SG265]|uniref:hypothetical protein n=1 Tax=Geotalea sp. SG265 TaxID=2922867 RepID=UPI001FB03719|nr:hypothetical protein [Geotalea sp. SG265]